MPKVRSVNRKNLNVERKKLIEKLLSEGYAPPGLAITKQIHGAVTEAARMLKRSPGSIYKSIERGTLHIDWSKYNPVHEVKNVTAPPPPPDIMGMVLKLARGRGATTAILVQKTKSTERAVQEAIEDLRGNGVSIHLIGGRWQITPPPVGPKVGLERLRFVSDAKGWHRFGVVGDSHLCSKHERLDVLNDLYDTFEKEGIKSVFHCGNWIDGEARFNKHELLVHGADGQCRYLAKNYPQRKGITTYAVTGDDHEGWYSQREGMDIGSYAENKFREIGRTDWVNLGYMNAYVDVVHKKSRASSIMEVCHPGGGSSYADTYAIQKIIESLEGGEKPAIWLGGHFHKMVCVEYRNVWCLLVGCTKDLDTFGKKKRLRYVVGGAIIEALQDPDTGAIPRFKADQIRYFNRGYYNNRWSHHGDVTHPEKVTGPHGQ